MGKKPESFSNKETKNRLEAMLRGAFSGPPKTYEDSKVGKAKANKPAKGGTKGKSHD